MTFLLCFCCTSAHAQGVSDNMPKSALNVIVTEAENGNPVQMATVYIVPAGDTLATAFTFTDKRGIASLKDFPAGKYTVNVQLLGFKPYANQ